MKISFFFLSLKKKKKHFFLFSLESSHSCKNVLVFHFKFDIIATLKKFTLILKKSICLIIFSSFYRHDITTECIFTCRTILITMR